MRKLKPQTISGYLRDSHRYEQLVTHGRLLERLTRLVREALPSPCDQHCRVASIKQNTLVLSADTPAWSARLRFHMPQVMRILQDRHGMAFHSTRILVASPRASTPEIPKPRAALSEKSADLLRTAANSVSDPELRAALLRLSRRGHRS
jgi:hypothetical protein